MRKQQQGFTLIEIAIVLVIIGLLLGGVLKGQELIQNARVRNVIAQQDGIKAAFFGFQDRYRGIPGDYKKDLANQNIPGAGTVCGGDGNSLIDTEDESFCAWFHLAKSNFITGNYTGLAGTGTSKADANNSPANPFGGLMQVIYDEKYADASATPNKINNIKTGINIPSTILAEVDRKIDDGAPTTGSFRFSDVGVPTGAACVTTTKTWDITGAQTVCGGASLF